MSEGLLFAGQEKMRCGSGWRSVAYAGRRSPAAGHEHLRLSVDRTLYSLLIKEQPRLLHGFTTDRWPI